MREVWKLGLKLLIITVVAGLALGFTNEITKAAIEKQAIAAEEAARKTILPDASEFEKIETVPDGIDNVYVGKINGEPVGYIAQITVKGYGGLIEVMVGMDNKGVITGINVGGGKFAETAGLGARSKEPKFMNQFIGLTPPAVLKENVDAISAATITSTAVVNAVNTASEYIKTLLG
ncbi:MAG: RnfABCDGE type electron transport complex subunit G [Clostridia bacterium]